MFRTEYVHPWIHVLYSPSSTHTGCTSAVHTVCTACYMNGGQSRLDANSRQCRTLPSTSPSPCVLLSSLSPLPRPPSLLPSFHSFSCFISSVSFHSFCPPSAASCLPAPAWLVDGWRAWTRRMMQDDAGLCSRLQDSGCRPAA